MKSSWTSLINILVIYELLLLAFGRNLSFLSICIYPPSAHNLTRCFLCLCPSIRFDCLLLFCAHLQANNNLNYRDHPPGCVREWNINIYCKIILTICWGFTAHPTPSRPLRLPPLVCPPPLLCPIFIIWKLRPTISATATTATVIFSVANFSTIFVLVAINICRTSLSIGVVVVRFSSWRVVTSNVTLDTPILAPSIFWWRQYIAWNRSSFYWLGLFLSIFHMHYEIDPFGVLGFMSCVKCVLGYTAY